MKYPIREYWKRSYKTVASVLVSGSVISLLLSFSPLQAGRLVAVGPNWDLPPAVSEADFPVHTPAKVELGKMLFFDKILSGNMNTSCATCHHPLTYTSDGLSLPVGEGGRGLGMIRDTGSGQDAIHERVPRNAPHVFNLGAFEFTRMFHDGRLEVDPSQPSGFMTPAGDDFPPGVETALAAQALFPVTSMAEMAGQGTENSIGEAAEVQDFTSLWAQLMDRLRGIDEYLTLFKAAYPEAVKDASDMTITQVANAIGAYEDVGFRAINSPFDRYLRGEKGAVSGSAMAGMKLFYGRAGCNECHSGPFHTDHQFHAVAMPQIGPGKGDTGPGGDPYGDFGHERVTGDANDRYRFRTPTLRNVAMTGPWGHAGAYNSLEAAVRHMLDPVASLEDYDPNQAALPSREDLDAIDPMHHENPVNRDAIAAASEITPTALSDHEVGQLLDFLDTLTDPGSLDLRDTIPGQVPSGLPLFE